MNIIYVIQAYSQKLCKTLGEAGGMTLKKLIVNKKHPAVKLKELEIIKN